MLKPLGPAHMDCPQWRKPMSKVCHKCPWWKKVEGTNPQNGSRIDDWDCAIAWLPILTIDVANQSRQGAAATESFRNVMVQIAPSTPVVDEIRANIVGGSPRMIEARNEHHQNADRPTSLPRNAVPAIVEHPRDGRATGDRKRTRDGSSRSVVRLDGATARVGRDDARGSGGRSSKRRADKGKQRGGNGSRRAK